MHDNQKQQVINAIRDLGRRVTSADVATKTGLPVLSVQQKLNEVAADTNGHMQVGKTGDIVYSFSPGFSNAYLAKGITAALLAASASVYSFLFYVVRISFGIALILSLLTIVVVLLVIAFVMIRGAGGDRDDGDGGGIGDIFGGGNGGGFHFSFWDWMILRDLLYWNSYSGYQPVRYQYNQPTVRKRARSSFLLNCFSFLFGDGDPNEGLDEKKWQLIAQVIKHNNNVVTADHLAPYLGSDPKDEDAVLPVLVRFNGRPEVTETGNIVYVFESMQSVAAEQNINPPPYLKEFPWKFSNTDQGELMPVYIVAGLNLVGAWYLNSFISQLRLDQLSPEVIPSIHWGVVLVPYLVAYGTAFVGIPIIRTVINNIRNTQIEKRNIRRFTFARLLEMPTPELTAKLREAYSYKIRDKHLTDQDVVFSTDEDSRDQADELSDEFKTMENRSAADKKNRTFNFSPDQVDAPAEKTEEDVRELPVAEEDKGTVIDITKARKMKVPKKNSDFDASP